MFALLVFSRFLFSTGKGNWRVFLIRAAQRAATGDFLLGAIFAELLRAGVPVVRWAKQSGASNFILSAGKYGFRPERWKTAKKFSISSNRCPRFYRRFWKTREYRFAFKNVKKVERDENIFTFNNRFFINRRRQTERQNHYSAGQISVRRQCNGWCFVSANLQIKPFSDRL